MLKKLLKYEFKSVSRILIPLLAGTLFLALITSVLFTVNYRYLSNNSDSLPSSIFVTVMITLLVFCCIAIAASSLVVFFILMQRYYKSFFGDEGYLTFTLPAKISEHLWAKLITGFVWTVLSIITIFISIMLLLVFGTAESGEIINTQILIELANAFKEMFVYFGTTNTIFYIIEFVILAVVGLASQMLLYYLAITIGSIIAKKHKILASIGAYFGINTVTGIIGNIIIVLISLRSGELFFSGENVFNRATHSTMILLTLVYIAMGTAAFLISKYMLKNKLNLE